MTEDLQSREYDDGSQLSRYVFDNYFELLTSVEKLAWKTLIAEVKAEHSEGRMADVLRKHWVNSSSEVASLLRGGNEEFRARVRDRFWLNTKIKWSSIGALHVRRLSGPQQRVNVFGVAKTGINSIRARLDERVTRD